MKSPLFTNSFRNLPRILHEEVQSTPMQDARLIAVSRACARDMGWDPLPVSDQILTSWLNGNSRMAGDQRLASRYAGHQFGVWAGQLGDGRAISLGEFMNGAQHWEIQTKGSGQTPFSREGDGKAVIRSSVREFLCSEAMHALGIPSTRALALLIGSDPVYRESVERSAIVARVFPSNIRFGHFEYCYHFGEKDAFRELTEYTRARFFPHCQTISAMLTEVVIQTADLIAKWMSVGFCHGVMNTDNMSILGLTIDYGPFGFMEKMDFQHICNHSDPRGRYSYENQPWVGLWNLDRLFLCFQDLVPVEDLKSILGLYESRYHQSWVENFKLKLGLEGEDSGDRQLIQDLLEVMQAEGLDFTWTFRILPHVQEAQEICKSAAFDLWFEKYELRTRLGSATEAERRVWREQRDLTNPQFVLKNYIAQEVIEDVEKDSCSQIETWLQILAQPFRDHPGFEKYSDPTPAQKQNLAVSCSS